MSLEVGTQLGTYKVVGPLGAGGMGEVYRATDTKLDREVALKVLPDSMATDSERVARFEREAKLLASLNHPHIAAIHGFEEAAGKRFLVLELVEGPTLHDRLKSGHLPVEEALNVGRQVAEALEAAHGRGIVHRDLKPANIKVDPEGQVKVLDFGLAKALAVDETKADRGTSPTITHELSQPGVILGTAAYMSPEQARGRPVDKRTDVFSFGCVLYECLTGDNLFGGETVSDSIGAVLHKEADLSLLPPGTPSAVAHLLRHCLAKDRRQRLRDIGDARLGIESAIGDASSKSLAQSATPSPARRVPIIACGVTAAIGLIIGILIDRLGVLSDPTPPAVTMPEPKATQLIVALPEEYPLAAASFLTPFAFSPDGRTLAYVALNEGRTQLCLRPLGSLKVTPLTGTNGAEGPFFSPDGQWIGYWADGKINKVPITGGSPRPICDSISLRGATWLPDDTIVFAPDALYPLVRVSATGGKPEPLTTLDGERRERSHRFPLYVADSKSILFSSGMNNFDHSPFHSFSLENKQRSDLLECSVDTRWIPTWGHQQGHLVFVQTGSLMAVSCDPADPTAMHAPVALLEGIATSGQTGAAHFAVSTEGTLVYLQGGVTGRDFSLITVDRERMSRTLAAERRAFRYPRLSPDGRHLVIMDIGGAGALHLWSVDTETGNLTRLTFEGNNYATVWTSDGERIIFTSDRSGVPALYSRRSDGTGSVEFLRAFDDSFIAANDVSPDGDVLVTVRNAASAWDIYRMSEDGSESRPFLDGPGNQYGARFSPDGKWLAYASDESDRTEVYVINYPDADIKRQVSNSGGSQAAWSPDGTELFYRQNDKLTSVAVNTDDGFVHEPPRMVLDGLYDSILSTSGFTTYDVMPDGKRFVIVDTNVTTHKSTHLHVVLNWFGALRRRVPSQGK